MPRRDYKTCKVCRRHASEAGVMSHERLCEECGERRRRENFDNLISHSGPWFLHWRRRIAASAGGVLLDDVRESR